VKDGVVLQPLGNNLLTEQVDLSVGAGINHQWKAEEDPGGTAVQASRNGLRQFRRFRICWDRKDEIQQAFHHLAAAVNCHRINQPRVCP